METFPITIAIFALVLILGVGLQIINNRLIEIIDKIGVISKEIPVKNGQESTSGGHS